MQTEELLARVTGFYVGTFQGCLRVTIQRRKTGEDTWAIVDEVGYVWSREGMFIYENLPSERNIEFLAKTRYTLDEALTISGLAATLRLTEEFQRLAQD